MSKARTLNGRQGAPEQSAPKAWRGVLEQRRPPEKSGGRITGWIIRKVGVAMGDERGTVPYRLRARIENIRISKGRTGRMN